MDGRLSRGGRLDPVGRVQDRGCGGPGAEGNEYAASVCPVCRVFVQGVQAGASRSAAPWSSAKLRTGGLTPDAFPEADEVARFLVSCAEARVAFKATAGLHHPLRSVQKLTYEPESASAWMHGFINLFVAAVVAYFGAGLEEVRAVLLEESPSAFAWSPAALTWHGKRFSTDQIREVRQRFAISFGSCSFTEPVDDLK